MTLEEIEGEYNIGWLNDITYGAARQRFHIVQFLRTEAAKGTAAFEYKLNKLADAIERGDHEC